MSASTPASPHIGPGRSVENMTRAPREGISGFCTAVSELSDTVGPSVLTKCEGVTPKEKLLPAKRPSAVAPETRPMAMCAFTGT